MARTQFFSGTVLPRQQAVGVIMAGGSGTRFWPASRKAIPKQFLSLAAGGETLLQATAARISGITSSVLVVAGMAHGDIVRQQLPTAAMFLEPLARNTAPCVGIAAELVPREVGDVPMIVLPADHFILNSDKLQQTLSLAVNVAQSEDRLVTIGIPPTAPETGYGYIEVATGASRQDVSNAKQVQRFVEKPNFVTAQEYVASGRYFWNSGMFVFRPSTILTAIERFLPELRLQLSDIMLALGEGKEEQVRQLFSEIKPISINYGVFERADNVCVIPGEGFTWSDIGSWTAWAECVQGGARNEKLNSAPNLIRGDAMVFDSNNCIVVGNTPQRFIGVVGVDNVIVVDTGDALLVCSREAAQDVKKIVQALEEKGRRELL